MQHTLTGLIDTHCHLNFKAFEQDTEQAIDRSFKAGISEMIVVGTDIATSKKALALAEKHPEIRAAVGYHPIHVQRIKNDNERQEIIDELAKLAEDEVVVAVGEIGLDYYREPFDKEQQKLMFRELLKLAQDKNKPVILHNRQAFADQIEILQEEKNLWRGVWHCFPGNWNDAQQALKMGWHLGFNGLITYSGDAANLEVVKKMPLERLVLETDSPYLTPVPKRGERNEPGNVKLVAQEIAKLRNMDVQEIINITTRNAQELFEI